MSKVFSEVSSFSLFLRDAGRYPLLSAEDEKRLLREFSLGSRKARDLIINSNLRFVVKTAGRYQGLGLELEDLVSEGCIGLSNALDRFCVSRGVRFITYAVYHVEQAIRKALREQSRSIRLPDDRCADLSRLHQAIEYVGGSVDDPAVLEKVSEVSGISVHDIVRLLDVSDDSRSLNDVVPAGDSFVELADRLSDFRTRSPEDCAMLSSLDDCVSELVSTLPSRERDIVRLYFGLGGRKPVSLQKIGLSVGLSKERVRQLKDQALKSLRIMAEGRGLSDYLAA